MSSLRGNGAGRASSSSSPSSASSPTRPPRDNRPLLSRSPSALLFPPAPPPLHITIRFSSGIPDLHLDIPSPQQTTVVALKHLIRGRLAADAEAEAEATDKTDDESTDTPQRTPASHAALARLRFIHNGRILPDASVLGAVLKAPPPPPLSHHADPKGKSPAGVPQQQRVFINCSIGDALDPSEIDAEATAAAAPPPPPSPSVSPLPSTPSRSPAPRLAVITTNLPGQSHLHPQSQSHLHPNSQPHQGHSHPAHTTTTTTRDNTNPNPNPNPNTTASPRPQGFDRLTQAGLTPSEISTLRSHFRAIHTSRFAPDAMPSPDTLRSMEDAWLDNDGVASHVPTTATAMGATGAVGYYAGGGGGGGSGSGGWEGDGGEDAGGGGGGAGAEDVFGLSAVAGPLIKGMLIGFVFPLGVIGWLGKEDGVWSKRMQFFVVFGVLLSVSVGLVRGLTGEG